MRTPSLLLALLAGAALSAAIVNATSELRIVDGDTIDLGWRLRLERARYRLAGIDTPETRGARCPGERSRGKAAAERLRSLVAGGGLSLSVHHARDRYGRGVASLTRGGQDVGRTLIDEGLARPYDGRSRRKSWCHDPAAPAR